jgi:2-polyprenyl-6-hydroxyphenyl methylase/3-demethylubiquinone-9 3-methyltransferase
MADNDRLEDQLGPYQEIFAGFGETDFEYLRTHYSRFVITKRILEATWTDRQASVLDVGAHWLHQAVLYARDGYRVTAADFTQTLAQPGVRKAAAAYQIKLLEYTDLAAPDELASLRDDSFDLILFTEILEHLAFNPVRMWRELYRLLRPGGRILIGTPNYYALRGRVWRNMPRFLRGGGAGLSVRDVLGKPTLGHHWKEYSLAELVSYFRILSPDFVPVRTMYVKVNHPSRGRAVVSLLEEALPFLRQNLHVEVELRGKSHGIVVDPSFTSGRPPKAI